MGPLQASRRTFLKLASGVGAAVTGLLAAVPALRAFVSPLRSRSEDANWVRLGEAEQFEFGVPTKVEFVETVQDAWIESRVLRSVWVYTDDGDSFKVYNGRCTHLACSYGFLEDQQIFRCPCHNGLYDLKTGAVVGGPPPRGLDTLVTKVEGGILHADFQNFRPGVSDRISV